MALSFDHLVHFVEKPEEAVRGFQEQGFHALIGGVHENRGTYNGLSYFDLSYIEFLGTYDRDLVTQAVHPAHSLFSTIIHNQFEEGFQRTAIRTTDIEGVAKQFRDKGLTVSGPVPLSRKRPDGSVLNWQLLYAGDEEGGPELPFIIQWNESDEERRNDLNEQKVIAPHQLGQSLQLDHVAYTVKDLNTSVKKWSELLHLQAEESYINENLNATGQALLLQGGKIVFYQPNGEGIVSRLLKEKGEKPFQVVFTGGNENKSFELLHGQFEVRKG